MILKKTLAAAALSTVAVLALTGCGSAQVLSLNAGMSGGPSKPPLPIIDSAALTFSVNPQSGPVGTVVTVAITGCGDTGGDNHALSYNAGDLAANTAAGEAAVHLIQTAGAASAGLTATFTIPRQAPGPSTFYFQCGQALASQPFTVTP